MKKQTLGIIALGTALCLAAGGIFAFDQSCAQKGREYREKAEIVRQELQDLKGQIEEMDQKRESARKEYDKIRKEYDTVERSVDESLEQVIRLYYSDDPAAQNVLLFNDIDGELGKISYQLYDFDRYEFQNMQEIHGNEFSYPEGPRFLSESGDQRILKLANLFLDGSVKSQEESRDKPFYEFSGWTVVFRDSGLEDTQGIACRAEERTFCVRDEENKILYVPADADCVDRQLLHGLAHVFISSHKADEGYKFVAEKLYRRRYEYSGALLSPTLHLTDQEEFMAEMFHGAFLMDSDLMEFNTDLEILTILWGIDAWYVDEKI
ncbi:MAG: hypothetical protein LUH04_03155 [Clostridium sp.]|nr:hypothetical protein [Clostridium sp.]